MLNHPMKTDTGKVVSREVGSSRDCPSPYLAWTFRSSDKHDFLRSVRLVLEEREACSGQYKTHINSP
jgi:hypothetical protein